MAETDSLEPARMINGTLDIPGSRLSKGIDVELSILQNKWHSFSPAFVMSRYSTHNCESCCQGINGVNGIGLVRLAHNAELS